MRSGYPLDRSIPGTAASLAALLAAAGALSAAGCSTISKPQDNSQVLAALDKEVAAARPAKPTTLRLAVAPVDVGHIRAGAAGEAEKKEGAAPAAGEGGAAPAGEGGAAPAGEGAPAPEKKKEGVFRYRREQTGEWVALRYRRPLYQELLFAPESGAEAPPPGAPGPLAPAAGPKPGDIVEWLCPRCQRTVSEHDAQCPSCGLLFAPEETPIEALVKRPAPAPAAPEAARPTPPGPEAAPEAAKVPPPAAVPPAPLPERFVCYQCGRVIPADQPVCEHCQIALEFPPGVTPPPGVEVRAPAGAPGGLGVQVGPLAPGSMKETTKGHATFVPDPDQVQNRITETLQGYNVFADVVPIKRASSDFKDDEAVVEWAAVGDSKGGFDYVLVPKVRRWEVSYVGRSGFPWYLGLFLWVAIGEPANLTGLPNAWIAHDEFRSDLEIEFKLYNVRSRNEIGTPWVAVHRGERSDDVNNWERGYYPWSIVAMPVLDIVRDSGYRELNEKISPHALNEILRSLVEQSVYPAFVKTPLQPQKPKEAYNVALLIGADSIKDSPIPPLPDVTNDIKLMQSTLAKLGIHDAAERPSGSRYVTFEGRNATRANIMGWLEKEMPRLSPHDFVLIYFAGYGAAEASMETRNLDGHEKYLVTYDTNVDDLAHTAISLSDLAVLVRSDQVNVRRMMIALDTSFGVSPRDTSTGLGRTLPGVKVLPEARSDDARRAKLQDPEFPFMNFLQVLAARGEGRRCFAVAAADQDQAAMEYADLGDGLFTSFFARGLSGEADRNKDGAVETQELFDYLRVEVRKEANVGYGIPQQIRWAGDTSMPVYLKPPSAAEKAKVPEKPAGE